MIIIVAKQLSGPIRVPQSLGLTFVWECIVGSLKLDPPCSKGPDII